MTRKRRQWCPGTDLKAVMSTVIMRTRCLIYRRDHEYHLIAGGWFSQWNKKTHISKGLDYSSVQLYPIASCKRTDEIPWGMLSTTSPKGLTVANGAEVRFLPREETLICCMSYIQQKVHRRGKITHRLKITVRSKWLLFKTFLKANFDKEGREPTHLPGALLRPRASLFDA